jgi:DNA-directed RNA polymerase subunit H
LEGCEVRFNVLEHDLVPEHHLLGEKETEEVLNQLRVSRDQLPKIRKEDPAIKILEAALGEVPEGSVIKIIRKSETAFRSVAYRLVIGR